jgi:hypothetical protein
LAGVVREYWEATKSWACNWNVKVKECIQNFSGEVFLGYNQLEDQEGDRRLLLRWILEKLAVRIGDG